MLPKLNRKRALFVLTKIDEILAWEERKETERDTRFVELGRYLCEVRAGQYWRVEKLKSFDESGAEIPGVKKEGVLPDVHPRASAAPGPAGIKGSGMDEGTGAGEGGALGRSGVRLCNLVAQSAVTAVFVVRMKFTPRTNSDSPLNPPTACMAFFSYTA